MDRLCAVDALRGVAALWVVLFHAFHLFGNGFTPDALPARAVATVAGLGYLGVDLFLVISGFCLTYPVARSAHPPDWRANWGRFYLARGRRILPPYYTALLLSAACLTVAGPQRLYLTPAAGWWDVPLHLCLLHNLSPAAVGSFSPVFWSLALEVQLYLAFPLVLWGIRRAGVWPTVVAALLLSVAWTGGAVLVCGPRYGDAGLAPTVWNALPARLITFCLGCAAAGAVANPRTGTRWAAALVAALALPAAVWSSWPRAGATDWGAVNAPLPHWLWPVVFAALLVCGCLSRYPGWLAWLAAVGRRSYSLYLVHSLVLVGVAAVMTTQPWGVAAAVALVASVAVAAVAFHLVERPFLRPASPAAPTPPPLPATGSRLQPPG